MTHDPAEIFRILNSRSAFCRTDRQEIHDPAGPFSWSPRSSVFSGRRCRPFEIISRFFACMPLYLMCFAPRVTITVQDVRAMRAQTISCVPLEVGFTAAASSAVDQYFAELYETAFSDVEGARGSDAIHRPVRKLECDSKLAEGEAGPPPFLRRPLRKAIPESASKMPGIPLPRGAPRRNPDRARPGGRPLPFRAQGMLRIELKAESLGHL